MSDRDALLALVAEVGRFRALGGDLGRRHARMVAALAGGEPGARDRTRYVRAVERYFRRFDAEASRRLALLERRLGALAQEQYNLVAERGVARGRVALVQGVRARAKELGAR